MDDTADTSGLFQLPGFALRRAANRMMGLLSLELAEFDLRISDASVMMLVADRTDMTSTEIGKHLDIQRANMVPILNRLEDAGLIRRDPIDRKSMAIVLTDQGQRTLAKVSETINRFERELIERIPEQHRPHFVPALLALLA